MRQLLRAELEPNYRVGVIDVRELTIKYRYFLGGGAANRADGECRANSACQQREGKCAACPRMNKAFQEDKKPSLSLKRAFAFKSILERYNGPSRWLEWVMLRNYTTE
ncbi:hypothetical protein [Vreelandella sp. GE22]